MKIFLGIVAGLFVIVVPVIISSLLFERPTTTPAPLSSTTSGMPLSSGVVSPTPVSALPTTPLVVYTPLITEILPSPSPTTPTKELSKSGSSVAKTSSQSISDRPSLLSVIDDSPYSPRTFSSPGSSRPSYFPPTEAQIFEELFPVYYRDALNVIQDQMIQVDFMKDGERITLHSQANIISFLNRSLDFAESFKIIPPEQIPIARQALNVEYPKVLEGRRRALLSTGIHPKTEPTGFALVTQSFSEGISNFFKGIFELPIVKAWFTRPECYKTLGPYPAPGPILWAFCCNCGIEVKTGIPLPVEDCLPFGAVCDIQLGCLNLMCRSFPAAIWDGWPPFVVPAPAPPPIGTCGCGP